MSPPTAKCLCEATRLTAALSALARRSPAQGATQAAWVLAQRMLAHRLDYDARVLHPGAFSPYAQQLDELTLEVAEAALGAARGALTPEQLQQQRLPAREGGFQLQRAQWQANAAHLAALAQCLSAVRSQRRRILPASSPDASMEAVDKCGWCDCLAQLGGRGRPPALA